MPRERVAELQKVVAGYQQYLELTQAYADQVIADQVIAHTRQAQSPKATPRAIKEG